MCGLRCIFAHSPQTLSEPLFRHALLIKRIIIVGTTQSNIRAHTHTHIVTSTTPRCSALTFRDLCYYVNITLLSIDARMRRPRVLAMSAAVAFLTCCATTTAPANISNRLRSRLRGSASPAASSRRQMMTKRTRASRLCVCVCVCDKTALCQRRRRERRACSTTCSMCIQVCRI